MPGLHPAAGDVVWIRQQRWRVERARRAQHVVCLDVAGHGRRLTFLSPFDRPVAVAARDRPHHVRPQQAVARLAGLLALRRGARTLGAAARADVAILPHQLEPAMALLTGARRVLVADEVGLGKTIEAGLAIAELLDRRPHARVLVIAPAALRRQWTDELHNRFRIACAHADAHALDRQARSGAPGDNPWRRSGVWIASLDYLKQPHVMDALPLVPWDLVVADEAHGACGDSARHEALDAVARRARQLLLLTATPHGGDAARFSRLMATGELPAIDDRLQVFRRTRAGLGLRLDRRVRWHRVGLSGAETHVLDVLATFEHVVLRAAGAGGRDAALLLLSVFRKRALSTMASLVTSINRRLRWLGDRQQDDDDQEMFWRQHSLNFDDESDAIADDERESLMAFVGLDTAQERSWLRRLRVLAETAQRHESKIARLIALVRRSPEPVAVFTEFRDSLETLRRRLEQVRDVAVLHGGQTTAEQQTALERFLTGAASVLLATDVASLGLNLQTRARWVVSLELPWNPIRLEQRAGRVDRIGQTRSVHATLLVARHPAEDGVLLRLARRTLSAQRRLGPDVLQSAVPDAATLRACLIAGEPATDAALEEALPEPVEQPLDLCRTWVRHARRAARELQYRRRLLPHWRAPINASTSAWAALTRMPAIAAIAGDTLIVLSVPIVEPGGEVVERHLVALSVPGLPRETILDRRAVAAARQCALEAVAPRAARIRRLRRAAIASLGARERAISNALIAARCPEEVQAGLFDRRSVRLAASARRDVDELRSDCEARVLALTEGVDVAAGRPVLELILRSRR